MRVNFFVFVTPIFCRKNTRVEVNMLENNYKFTKSQVLKKSKAFDKKLVQFLLGNL